MARKSATPDPQAEQTILVVEDDPILRAQLKDHLEDGPYKVVEAPSARAALDQLNTLKPDLVVLDLVLPDRSGYEVCESIRNDPRTKDVPVLVVSARLLPSHRAQAEEAGASAFLPKPYQKRELLKQLRELLPGHDLEVTKS